MQLQHRQSRVRGRSHAHKRAERGNGKMRAARNSTEHGQCRWKAHDRSRAIWTHLCPVNDGARASERGRRCNNTQRSASNDVAADIHSGPANRMERSVAEAASGMERQQAAVHSIKAAATGSTTTQWQWQSTTKAKEAKRAREQCRRGMESPTVHVLEVLESDGPQRLHNVRAAAHRMTQDRPHNDDETA